MSMLKLMISLPQVQVDYLKVLADQAGTSLSEMIRRQLWDIQSKAGGPGGTTLEKRGPGRPRKETQAQEVVVEKEIFVYPNQDHSPDWLEKLGKFGKIADVVRNGSMGPFAEWDDELGGYRERR